MSGAFKKIDTVDGIEELELTANGLRVLLVPEPAVPVATVCVVYHVGSRNEGVGHTGATHLLEHLMFKGSRRFDPRAGRSIARTLERVGASYNATTWFDRTNYYETVPPEHLELALELEADRMRHALLRDEDLVSEMTVVRNEFERGENEPFDVLIKDSFAIAFREHPYHHPTIGWRDDIENVTIDRLRALLRHLLPPRQRDPRSWSVRSAATGALSEVGEVVRAAAPARRRRFPWSTHRSHPRRESAVSCPPRRARLAGW